MACENFVNLNGPIRIRDHEIVTAVVKASWGRHSFVRKKACSTRHETASPLTINNYSRARDFRAYLLTPQASLPGQWKYMTLQIGTIHIIRHLLCRSSCLCRIYTFVEEHSCQFYDVPHFCPRLLHFLLL